MMDRCYPQNIIERLAGPSNSGDSVDANAAGKSASFECGTFVRISLRVNEGIIEDIRFRSNGCGYAVAAADSLCSSMRGRPLTDLHGFYRADAERSIEEDVCGAEGFPAERSHCAELAIDALKKALSEYRRGLIEEFRGEKPLICTCFGVTEETITELAAGDAPMTVEAIGELTNAGTGCGSCRMIIQEVLDGYSVREI